MTRTLAFVSRLSRMRTILSFVVTCTEHGKRSLHRRLTASYTKECMLLLEVPRKQRREAG
jgi:hypothetical protein